MRKVIVPITPAAKEFFKLIADDGYKADDRLSEETKALLLWTRERLEEDERNRIAQPRRTLIALVLGPPWVLWVMYLMDVWGQCGP